MSYKNKQITHKKIDPQVAERIAKELKKQTFKTATKVFYQGQKPIAALLILSGSVKILCQKKIVARYDKNTIILFSEFLNREELPYDVEVSPSSTICWMDKDVITENPEAELAVS